MDAVGSDVRTKHEELEASSMRVGSCKLKVLAWWRGLGEGSESQMPASIVYSHLKMWVVGDLGQLEKPRYAGRDMIFLRSLVGKTYYILGHS